MDLKEKFSEPVFRNYSITIVVFALLFPAYFGFASSSITTLMPAPPAGEVSSWEVTFNETIVQESEDVCFADDGATCTISLAFSEVDEMKDLLEDGGLTLAAFRFTLTYAETDEQGQWPDQCDDIDAELDFSDVSSAESGHVSTASMTDCDAGSMVVVMVDNYSGENFTASNISKSTIQDNWAGQGDGWGEYVTTISVSTNTGSVPAPGPNPVLLSNNEDGEEVNVKMEVIAYKLDFKEVEASTE